METTQDQRIVYAEQLANWKGDPVLTGDERNFFTIGDINNILVELSEKTGSNEIKQLRLSFSTAGIDAYLRSNAIALQSMDVKALNASGITTTLH